MTSTITDRIQGISTSVAVKAPCKAATTAAITLSGEQTIDGVACVAGDSVLVKNQSSSADDGIYYVSTTAWTRREDFDAGDDAVNGTTVYVLAGGTSNGGNWFQVTFPTVPPVIGTTTQSWTKTYVALNATSQATESLAGVAEIATQTETNTGTDDARIVTPLKLKTLLSATPYTIQITSTDAGNLQGPTLDLYRNSASPANLDQMGEVIFTGKNSAGVTKEYAQIICQPTVITSGSEVGALEFSTYDHTPALDSLRMTIGAGMFMRGATLGDMGQGTINATEYYKNGVVLNSSAKVVSITAATPYTTNTALSTTIPVDDTVPTLTEGNQILTVSTSTTSNTQKIRLQFRGTFNIPTVGAVGVASLNDGSTTLAVDFVGTGSSATTNDLHIDHTYSPAAVGSYTFNIRVGCSSGSIYPNGSSGGRLFGGVAACTLVATVYEP